MSLYDVNVSFNDIEFEVSIYSDPEMVDCSIDEIYIKDSNKPIELSDLYVKQKDKFISLEEIILELAVEALIEEGGAKGYDEAMYADTMYDQMREC